jgi:ubiquinone biosynthesis protein COQ4
MAVSFDEPAACPEMMGKRPRRPLVAFKAFRKLSDNKEDTLQVFEIIRALSGSALASQYQRLLATAEGGRQAYRGEELADRLQDMDWLDGLPEGSVGALYRQFIALRGLSAYGLADESRKLGEVDVDAAHPISWFARRLRDVHDIWHVLTGYGTDALGEACVIAFTFAQTGNVALAFLAVAAALDLKSSCPKVPYLRTVFQAWRHGRKTAWLVALDYERLLAEPLADARHRLNIAQPTHYEAVPLAERNAYRFPAEPALSGFWPHETV